MLAVFFFGVFLFLLLAPAFVPLVGFVAAVGLNVLGAAAGFFGTALLCSVRWGLRWPDGRLIVPGSALLFVDVACRFSVPNIEFQCPGLFFGCSGVRFDRGSLSRHGGSSKFEF